MALHSASVGQEFPEGSKDEGYMTAPQAYVLGTTYGMLTGFSSPPLWAGAESVL